MAERASAASLRETLNILYYGPAGKGKTTNVASMGNLGRVVHVDAESGVKPRALKARGINLNNIEVYPNYEEGEVITYEGLDDLYWELKATLTDETPEGEEPTIGVSWDSVTEIQKALMDAELRKSVEKSNRKGMERDIFDVHIEDWGKVADQMRALIRRYRDLPCHFAIAGLERRDQDDDGKVSYGVNVMPSLQSDLEGYMDVVCHLTTENVPGWGRTGEMFIGTFRAGGKYEVKDRFDILPARLVDPTFERVLAYLNEELTEDTDPVAQSAAEAIAEATKAVVAASEGEARRPARRPVPRKAIGATKKAAATTDAEPEESTDGE